MRIQFNVKGFFKSTDLVCPSLIIKGFFIIKQRNR
jgi:hypothetical protein